MYLSINRYSSRTLAEERAQILDDFRATWSEAKGLTLDFIFDKKHQILILSDAELDKLVAERDRVREEAKSQQGHWIGTSYGMRV